MRLVALIVLTVIAWAIVIFISLNEQCERKRDDIRIGGVLVAHVCR